MSNEVRIFDWAQNVVRVDIVQEINKTFGGLKLYDSRDAKAVVGAVNYLLEYITGVENISEIGLGVPYWKISAEESRSEQVD